MGIALFLLVHSFCRPTITTDAFSLVRTASRSTRSRSATETQQQICEERIRCGKSTKKCECESYDSVVKEKVSRSDAASLTIQPLRRIALQASRSLSTVFALATVAASTATLWSAAPPSAAANEYGSLSEEQMMVAEAWRLVDRSFIERTFNGQDWFAMREKYVKKTKYKSMDQAQASVAEMLSTLGDKYTRYLPPNKYQSIVDSATGTLSGAGIGVQISVSDDNTRLAVSDVEDNSPAKQAGIKPGDLFVEVDGKRFDSPGPFDTNNNPKPTPDDVALKLRGPVGSKVGVVMERPGGKPIEAIITRKPITITAVKSYLSTVPGLKGKVGVIRIKSFSGTTAETVGKELAGLKAKGATNLLIDVRGNPGGLLPGGVDTASLFLDAKKPVVFVVNKNNQVDTYSSLSAGVDLESPLVVLTDGGTASAAEVFSAGLKENGRALLAGKQTFGKGIVQTVRSLSEGANGGVAVTVARYETPQHNDINKAGIPVDVPASTDCPNDAATLCVKASAFQKPTASTAAIAGNAITIQ